MTLPNERFRAIRWGGELLQQMQADSSVPAGMRDRAREIAKHYPTDAALRALLEREPAAMPESWADAVEDARSLFDDLAWSDHAGNAETRHRLLYAMRHYPLPGETHRYEHGVACLGWWLQPD